MIKMPKTILGKWSVGLIIVFFLSFALVLLLVASDQRGGDTLSDNLVFINPMLLAGICGISSFFTGLISIIKNKERSVLVFFATATGLFILFLYLGEILSLVGILPPH